MRAHIRIAFVLLTAAMLAVAAKADDAAGCVDLKLLPRLEGCIIQECSAKQHDSFDAGERAGTLDANVNTVRYSCPAAMDLERVQRELEAEIHKAGFLNMAEDKTDPASPVITTRKGSHWLRWNVSSEDGITSYSLTSVESATEKFKAETCALRQVISTVQHCEVVECNSKSEDSVAMRTAQTQETSLTGNVQTLMLSCSSFGPAQLFSALESDLRASGFEILFSGDREHPEGGWMTGRAGKRWVELVSTPDSESGSYMLTVVPAAEVLAAANPEPSRAPVAVRTFDPEPASPPAPAPVPKPVQVAAAVAPPVPDVTPVAALAPPIAPSADVSAPVETPIASFRPVFVPPKPILKVPIAATPDRINSIVGDVQITILVDVSDDGVVTKAELDGHITKNVLKLQDAALEAVSHWRFEPARQDGRIVAAVKIPVLMYFRGRPWRF